MKKKFLLLAIIGIVIIIAAITNPNQDRHKEIVKTKFTSLMQKALKDNSSGVNDSWGNAGQALGSLFGGAIVDNLVNNLVSTDNYILFSTTKINWEGESRTIGIGIFGNVFLSGKIDETFENGLLNKTVN